ncbi:tetratricopeptide repeat protein [Hankyongella ginsenosidimutans]|uniref:Tetratricopeptide repeat protein n=1 Tax=Hankyongella ginsenosidimutans TaxID=1763828 RepID=A0A4D7C9X2_9SPHN|nr:tetratricopeptide repeat protein [Hankyongella ginsenosidimutans]QCI79873.1 tetratricopeptide repeat protein [Hankyongella ginsenosidimutans]
MAKAPTPTTDDPLADAFIREVDDDYRRDQLARLWQRYGRGLLVVAGLFLVGLAGYLYWRDVQQKELANQSVSYTSGLKQLEGGDVTGRPRPSRRSQPVARRDIGHSAAWRWPAPPSARAKRRKP